jgi:hypothetical protein
VEGARGSVRVRVSARPGPHLLDVVAHRSERGGRVTGPEGFEDACVLADRILSVGHSAQHGLPHAVGPRGDGL